MFFLNYVEKVGRKICDANEESSLRRRRNPTWWLFLTSEEKLESDKVNKKNQ